ncbi:MAG TPA: hypothetical protein VGU45_13150 [Microvirga sp.]|jgi:hypothetical protein|nr:hypothetical protein [Microvirga sp.]
MADKGKDKASDTLRDISVDGPRLTPQGRTDPEAGGEDSTNPMGEGAKQGQGDKAEG